MLSNKDIEQAASFLANQTRVGIPIFQVVQRMEQLQPKHKDMWVKCRFILESGGFLSEGLKGYFPDTVVQAISAGEQAGRLVEVLERVEQTMLLQQKIQGTVLQLGYPVGLCTAGFSVFVFFMVQVMPTLQKSLGGMTAAGRKAKSPVFQLSDWMVGQFESNGIFILTTIIALIVMCVWALKQEEIRSKVLGSLLAVPIVGKALTFLYFGLYIHYVALLDSSGSFSAKDRFLVPAKILPGNLSDGVKLFAEEIELRGLASAADPDMQPDGDPRKKWPFYVCSAIMVAHETGRLDKELERVAPALIKEGFLLIEKTVQIANIIALVLAGMLIITPLAAYYWQMGQVFKQAMAS